MSKAPPARRLARREHWRRTRRPPGRGGRYGLLLAILITNFLLSAFSGKGLVSDVQIVLLVLVLVLALRTSPLPGRWPAVIDVFAVTGSIVVLGAMLTNSGVVIGVAEGWKSLMLLTTVVLVVRDVLARPTVTIQSIYGALSAYLIIGLMFASGYSAIAHLTGSDFFAGHQPADARTFQYFSFTTLTTLGYGDFTAAGNGGRAVAVMEALTGQVFLATLVARLVAAFRPSPRRRSRSPNRHRSRGARGGGTTTRHRKRPAHQVPARRDGHA